MEKTALPYRRKYNIYFLFKFNYFWKSAYLLKIPKKTLVCIIIISLQI